MTLTKRGNTKDNTILFAYLPQRRMTCHTDNSFFLEGYASHGTLRNKIKVYMFSQKDTVRLTKNSARMKLVIIQ